MTRVDGTGGEGAGLRALAEDLRERLDGARANREVGRPAGRGASPEGPDADEARRSVTRANLDAVERALAGTDAAGREAFVRSVAEAVRSEGNSVRATAPDPARVLELLG